MTAAGKARQMVDRRSPDRGGSYPLSLERRKGRVTKAVVDLRHQVLAAREHLQNAQADLVRVSRMLAAHRAGLPFEGQLAAREAEGGSASRSSISRCG